jgi:hypothetical protein
VTRWMRTGTLTAACVLAACGAAEGEKERAADDTPPAAPADSARPANVSAAAATDTAFTFRTFGDGETIDSIAVMRGGRAVQVLRAPENSVADPSVDRISRIDLDFDGFADLALMTDRGMVNSRSAYWRLDPRADRFEPAGEGETLQPDSAAREHVSFNRGGHAGRLWTASRWRWMDGAVAEVRREEQDVLPGTGGYVRIVHERRGGALVEVARDTLDEAEWNAGPSWQGP